jgi:hypothetical protein
MEHGAPCLAVDVEGQSNLVSWCTSTGLLAVGCTPSLHNGAATVRIIPLSSPSVASTLHIPLEGKPLGSTGQAELYPCILMVFRAVQKMQQEGSRAPGTHRKPPLACRFK